jgi:lysine 2,3-aminomutase
VRDMETLDQLVTLSEGERRAVAEAKRRKLPFGITPYYVSLMDDDSKGHDLAVRAQVIPPMDYVERIADLRGRDSSCLDFMREEDTSPLELITRRYPTICILKPFNTCPQICVYCQRNWEIEDAMAQGAYAGEAQIVKCLSPEATRWPWETARWNRSFGVSP